MPSLLARLAARLRGRKADAGGGRGARGTDGGESTASARQGLWGEREAEKWLVRRTGMKCLGRRVKVGRDEIDLVEVYGRAGAGEEPRIEHQRAAVPMELRYSAPALARRR